MYIKILYDDSGPKKKAKESEANDIYAFQTKNNYYGVLKVIPVTESES